MSAAANHNFELVRPKNDPNFPEIGFSANHINDQEGKGTPKLTCSHMFTLWQAKPRNQTMLVETTKHHLSVRFG